MKLSEAYNKAIIGEFWEKLEEGLLIDEGANGLDELIAEANEIIFKKFRIQPSEQHRYCIVGSARLHLYPALRDAFGLTSTIGDLDIVVPNREDWINAGLENEWNAGGIYRPEGNDMIEAFSEWLPQKASGEYADVNVRSTDEIIRSSTKINGYYFMTLQDIVDYKLGMDREKEQQIVNLIKKYQESGSNNKSAFLRKMAKIIGIDKTKEFLGRVKD